MMRTDRHRWPLWINDRWALPCLLALALVILFSRLGLRRLAHVQR